MPVSFRPASHAATQYNIGPASDAPYDTHILKRACPSQYEQADEILQSSFSVFPPGSKTIVPQSSGFVRTVVQAYNTHQALVLRPDDVWLAILTQFNAFVNGNAERLRSCFVAHEGKKELVIHAAGTRYTVDFGDMSRQMAEKIEENVVDKDLTEWIIPNFSTTTLTDKTVSCMVMMATLKAYFSYTFALRCGIPLVTLEGSKEDWELLRRKAEKLKEYGVECIAWYHLLIPVLEGFIRAFNDPHGRQNIHFWQLIVDQESMGSGPTYLSGWITAFSVFNAEGKWAGPRLREVREREVNAASLSTRDFWAIFKDPSDIYDGEMKQLTLNDTVYHIVDISKLPVSFADVDVKLDDNGEIFDCMIVAGLVGTEVCSSGDKTLSATGVHDTLRPIAGWWMFTKGSRDPEDISRASTVSNGLIGRPEISSAGGSSYSPSNTQEDIYGPSMVAASESERTRPEDELPSVKGATYKDSHGDESRPTVQAESNRRRDGCCRIS